MPTALLVQPPHAPGGNRTTALRWARILRGEGWEVRRVPGRSGLPAGPSADLILALHATKTAEVVAELRRAHPAAPVVLAATGTDLYLDVPAGDPVASAALASADRIVVLQERALGALPAPLRARARVIHQSTPTLRPAPGPDEARFEALMLAGVRTVKDPECAREAVARLPEGSALHLDHFGPALEPALAARLTSTARYTYGGPVRRSAALLRLARARVLVSPSREEGGANVVTEAFAQGTAVVAARSEGALGLLGEEHPGLFEPGDAGALSRLLRRCEEEPAFLATLRTRSRERAWMADPERERAAWRSLLAELGA